MCPRHFLTPLPAHEGPSGNQAGLEHFDPGAGRPAATLTFCPSCLGVLPGGFAATCWAAGQGVQLGLCVAA